MVKQEIFAYDDRQAFRRQGIALNKDGSMREMGNIGKAIIRKE